MAVASRFCHPAEQNYSPVEGEALSASAGLHKFRHFVMGCKDLYLVVDHKPLVKLLGDRNFEDIPYTRLLRLKEKTLSFRFTVSLSQKEVEKNCHQKIPKDMSPYSPPG